MSKLILKSQSLSQNPHVSNPGGGFPVSQLHTMKTHIYDYKWERNCVIYVFSGNDEITLTTFKGWEYFNTASLHCMDQTLQ